MIDINNMTLEEKVGQLFMLGVQDEQHMTTLIDKYHVGGIIYFTRNVETAYEAHRLSGLIKKKSKIPQRPEDFFSLLDFGEGDRAGGKVSSGSTTSGSSVGRVGSSGAESGFAESFSGFGSFSLLAKGFPEFNG